MFRVRIEESFIRLFLWCILKYYLFVTVILYLKDKLNFRLMCSLNFKLKKVVFKDVISSMYLEIILYVRVRN